MGKFSIKKTKTGVVFNLVAKNGQVIGTSQVYASKKTCLNGIKSVQNNAVIANIEDQTVDHFEKQKNPKFEIYHDKANEFRFRLLAKNGQNIIASEGYKTKKSCLNGIESVQKNAPNAELVNQE